MEKPRIRIRADGTLPEASRQALFTAYGNGRRDAGRSDLPEMNGWNPPPGFAGSNSYGERDAILGRARDLDKNNAWINGGLDRRVESVIGGSIRLAAQPELTILNRDYDWRMKWTAKTEARFKVWGKDIERRCDARQTLTFGQIAKLAYLTYLRDGEAAAEIRDDQRGISNTTNVLLFEAERISTPSDRMLEEGPLLRNGIAFASSGAPIGYYVASRHPADSAGRKGADRWDYVPRFGKTGRAKLVHVFSPRFAEQNRGISRLAEAMVPAKMLDRVDRAEVQAALKAAILSFFIKSPGSTDDLQQALAPTGNDNEVDAWVEQYLDYRTKSPVRMDAAQIIHLLPDEDVVTPDANHPNTNYPAFARFVLQKVAASLGISYPQLSQDWSGINYSSARALLNELWRSFLEDREFFTQQFCTPIYAAWLEVEVANGDITIPGGPANFYRNKTAICMAEWIGPGRGSVDPLKEANADNLDTAAGRKSTVEAILERGRDPSDVLAEEDWYLKERAKRSMDAPNHNVKAAPTGAEDDPSETEPAGVPPAQPERRAA
ncbi:phage portal protein [uncultured Sphingobium sp.]|mgnify:FL=1|uniref:phage portal protein n=1 Tax=uncultured Sphingobium sp. TaxID=316087 RepID=UPI0032B2ACEB|tara:strand:+ start:23162 stop:24808 length:1647 start_codon:yes stop_codon:yes gene_type:complete